ncbi:PDZ domain-containing protein, partial [Treponema endosymbiont of Eucomonympha sp.]|uniref:PDZ domain-containing protein n=1 Tax=Treponema endosymbiont of Eucomonympha sp. TaxID=1580831 RepID=UPI000A597A22
NVRPSPKAKELADQSGVDIRKYNIIYKAVEEITQAMEGMLQPEEKEEVIGMAEVREVFKIPKVGVIAGSYMTQGFIKQSASVHILRDNIVIYTGKVSSLRRFKDKNGAFVSQIYRGSPAQKGGMQAGDFIVSLNRKPVETVNQLVRSVGD